MLYGKNGLELEVEDIQKITELVQPVYTKGRRNNIVFGLSGVLRVEGICRISTSSIIEMLAGNDGISQESDVKNALKVVEQVFNADGKVPGKIYLRTFPGAICELRLEGLNNISTSLPIKVE